MDSTIRLAMNYQLVIEDKRVTKDEVIAIALNDLMVKQEKIINKYCAKLCKWIVIKRGYTMGDTGLRLKQQVDAQYQ